MRLNNNEKHFLFHEFLRHLGLFVFYSFGALLFYEVTKSIEFVLILGIVYYGSGILTRSVAVPLYVRIKSKVGIVPLMGIGLAIVATANGAIYFAGSNQSPSLLLIIILLLFFSFGSGMYWTFSNIVKLKNIGQSTHPASYSSYLIIARMMAALLATGVSIILSFQDYFLILMILSSVSLFLSLIPLLRMKDGDHNGTLQFRRVLSRISPLALAANIKVVPEFLNYGATLFFLITFVSLPTSVFVTGASYMVAVAFSYIVGRFVDHKHNGVVALSSLAIMVGFLGFTQMSSVVGFIIILSVINISTKGLRVATDARLGQEMVQSDNNLEFIVAVEVARNIGSVLALVLILIIYVLSGTIPQELFAVGALLVVPAALYGINFRAR